MGQDAVDGHTALVLAALAAAHDSIGADPLDEGVAHVGQRRVTVEAALLLHLDDRMLDHVKLVLIQRKPGRDILVALHQLGRGEAEGDTCRLRVILDQMRHGVDAAVHRPIVAEVVNLWQLTCLCGLYSQLGQLVNAFIFCGADWDDRDTQPG